MTYGQLKQAWDELAEGIAAAPLRKPVFLTYSRNYRPDTGFLKKALLTVLAQMSESEFKAVFPARTDKQSTMSDIRNTAEYVPEPPPPTTVKNVPIEEDSREKVDMDSYPVFRYRDALTYLYPMLLPDYSEVFEKISGKGGCTSCTAASFSEVIISRILLHPGDVDQQLVFAMLKDPRLTVSRASQKDYYYTMRQLMGRIYCVCLFRNELNLEEEIIHIKRFMEGMPRTDFPASFLEKDRDFALYLDALLMIRERNQYKDRDAILNRLQRHLAENIRDLPLHRYAVIGLLSRLKDLYLHTDEAVTRRLDQELDSYMYSEKYVPDLEFLIDKRRKDAKLSENQEYSI